MLEICFNDSVKVMLQIAQQHATGTKEVGAVSVSLPPTKNKFKDFFARKKAVKEYIEVEETLKEQAVEFCGSPKDVLGLAFEFSEGDIQSPITPDNGPRLAHLNAWLNYNQHGDLDTIEMKTKARQIWDDIISDWQKLKQGTEKVRIWVDDSADARCGLLFVANLLENTDTEISMIKLPRDVKNDHFPNRPCRQWSDVPSALFGTFLKDERILNKDEISKLARRWRQLQKENTPLRVVADNKVISANEDYFDEILKEAFEGEVNTIAQVISRITREGKVPMGFEFIASRVKILIQQGDLVVVEEVIDRWAMNKVCTVK